MTIGWQALARSVMLAAMLLAAAGCATTHPAYKKGQELLAAGQWEEGIAQIERAAQEDSRNYTYRAAVIDARGRALAELLRQGAALREAGRYAEAEAQFRRALRIHPEDGRALAELQKTAVERRIGGQLAEAAAALDKNDLRAAEKNVRAVLVEIPKHPRALALLKRIEEKKPRPSSAQNEFPALLKKPITLQFRDANLKMIFDVISRETGINFALDRDIRADTKASIFAKNTPLEDAIESLLATNGLAKKVVSDSNVLIYPNTPQKAREYQELVIRNFYLASADAKQMQSLIRTILKSTNVYIDEKRNVLVMRDTPEAIRLAERLIAANDQVEPEVMLEVEILEVTRNKSSEIGTRFPDQITAGVANPIALRDLNRIDSSGVNIGGLSPLVAINLNKLYNNVNLLANPRIRVRNREKAKIHVGDRVPVISSTTSTVSALSTQAVNYLDVGIKLEVEPQVMDDEVMIKIGLEVSSLGAQVTVQNSVAYQVGTRNATTTLTLKDGETQILAGLITDTERATINKLPGLGDFPLLGRLFSSDKSATEKTEIVLSITPRIIRRMVRPSADLAEYWSGPETNLRSGVGVTSSASPQVPTQAGFPQRSGGVFPGSSTVPVQTAPGTAAPGVAGTLPVTPPMAPATPPAPAPAPAAPPSPFNAPPTFFQPPPGAGG